MEIFQPKPSVLIVSTVAPWPVSYGNRARVAQTVALYESWGYEISFVLLPADKEWASAIPQEYDELRARFSYVAVVPPSGKLHFPPSGEFHLIDEWWDEQLEYHLRWLLTRK